MITNITSENFKSFKKISVDTKNLNLLMGLNGMGKTSFIQILLLLVQSDKLEKGIIELNGTLVRIGQGKDALYQFAQDEHIRLGLTIDSDCILGWEFEYESDQDELSMRSRLHPQGTDLLKKSIKQFQYISTSRIGPQELYPASTAIASTKKQLGLSGEYTPHFLDIWGDTYIVPQMLRHHESVSEKLLAQTNAWLKEISPGISIATEYLSVNRIRVDYVFDLQHGKTGSFRPVNIGFGISYILPVIVSLLTSEEGKIIVIENPESHIHPRGQAELGRLIALAAQNGAQLFIETHSDHILNGIRVAVKEKNIDKDNVNILFFDKITTEFEQYSEITSIRIDKNGTLSFYPENFLDEWTYQLSKLV
jgi:predicted ATPase